MDIISIISKIAEKEQWDLANEYGEPGYSGIPVLGNYWKRDDEGKLYGYFDGKPRIEQAMRDANIELEWSDEWYVDWENGGKAWRITPDCYQWQPSIHFGDGYVLTPDDDIDAWIAEMVNDPTKALNQAQVKANKLTAAGFEPWPDEDTHYEHGWHPGQTADPTKVYDDIRRINGDDVDVIFHIDETSQFYIKFRAYIRPVVKTWEAGDKFTMIDGTGEVYTVGDNIYINADGMVTGYIYTEDGEIAARRGFHVDNMVEVEA